MTDSSITSPQSEDTQQHQDVDIQLRECRKQIDALDRQIVELLNARARIVERVGQIKQQGSIVAFIPEREESVYENVRKTNRGPLGDDALKAIYREILSSMRSLEDHLTIAYLGPAHTFTHEAAQLRFGSAALYVPQPAVQEVFRTVERGLADYGVVAIENSLQGIVTATLDSFIDIDPNLKICAEIILPISHFLLGIGPLEHVRRVYSHPMALGQCRNWLAAHLVHCEQIEVSSTSRAAELAQEDALAAAIGSKLAANHYGLRILAEHLEDRSDNATRFYVLGRQLSQPTGNDRTALMLSIRDRIGALHDITGCLVRHNINMTHFDHRPSRRKVWDYIFFIEITGHSTDPEVEATLDELREYCLAVRVLGSWRTGELAAVRA
ncbi:MAG: prephenate dehydratase [Chloroflexi bacterium]|nr:prephenate dehydratase [Chloroflexota bacterium]